MRLRTFDDGDDIAPKRLTADIKDQCRWECGVPHCLRQVKLYHKTVEAGKSGTVCGHICEF